MSVKVPYVIDGRYSGSMCKEQCDYILSVRNSKCISALKNMIYSFPPEVVIKALDEGLGVLQMLYRDGIDPVKEGYIGELRDYQTTGAGFMYIANRSIIGDGVGLGKTVEISALLNILKKKKEMSRFLMAVESTALGQTLGELMKYTGLNIVLLPSTKKRMLKTIEETDWRKVDGIVTSHSALKSDVLTRWIGNNLTKDLNRCNLFDTFILDESFVVKNDTTKQSAYIRNICDLCKRVHFMNATVFETSILDIYNQIDLLDSSVLPSKSEIEKQFSVWKSGGTYWVTDKKKGPVQRFKRERVGYKNQEIFKKKLELYYFARCKEDVGLVSQNVYKVYEVEPSYEQQVNMTEYRYNELLNNPVDMEDIDIIFDRKHVPKLNKLCELVENNYMQSKVMIYCFHLKAQEVIAEEMRKIGKNPIILNGQDKSKHKDINRLKIAQSFNTGDSDVIITNIMRSLNLYDGDVCIVYSLVTNPSKQTQIAGRIDRNVDNKLKTFILLLYAGTPEERMFKQVIGKRESDGRSLSIDAKGAVSNFIEALECSEEIE